MATWAVGDEWHTLGDDIFGDDTLGRDTLTGSRRTGVVETDERLLQSERARASAPGVMPRVVHRRLVSRCAVDQRVLPRAYGHTKV